MGRLQSDKTMTAYCFTANAHQLRCRRSVLRPITPDLPRLTPGRVAGLPIFSLVFSGRWLAGRVESQRLGCFELRLCQRSISRTNTLDDAGHVGESFGWSCVQASSC